jgi:hypothetical protein
MKDLWLSKELRMPLRAAQWQHAEQALRFMEEEGQFDAADCFRTQIELLRPFWDKPGVTGAEALDAFRVKPPLADMEAALLHYVEEILQQLDRADLVLEKVDSLNDLQVRYCTARDLLSTVALYPFFDAMIAFDRRLKKARRGVRTAREFITSARDVIEDLQNSSISD